MINWSTEKAPGSLENCEFQHYCVLIWDSGSHRLDSGLALMHVFWNNLHPASQSESNMTFSVRQKEKSRPITENNNKSSSFELFLHLLVTNCQDVAPSFLWCLCPKRLRTGQTWTVFSMHAERENKRARVRAPYSDYSSHYSDSRKLFLRRHSWWKCAVWTLLSVHSAQCPWAGYIWLYSWVYRYMRIYLKASCNRVNKEPYLSSRGS